MEWDTGRQHYICIGIKIYKIEAVLNLDEFVSIQSRAFENLLFFGRQETLM